MNCILHGEVYHKGSKGGGLTNAKKIIWVYLWLY